MPRHPDRLDDLHAQLLADARQQPDYAAGTVPSIAAYSEGAEHALDSVRLQGYGPKRPANLPDRDELARELFIKDNWRSPDPLAEWERRTAGVEEIYTHVLADAAIEAFRKANQ